MVVVYAWLLPLQLHFAKSSLFYRIVTWPHEQLHVPHHFFIFDVYAVGVVLWTFVTFTGCVFGLFNFVHRNYCESF